MKIKQFISFYVIALCVLNIAKAEQWPPANETPERAAIFLEPTYEHPEKVKVGVTLFIAGWNNRLKGWNEPFYYGKIAAIQKNKRVNGQKCDAFTTDSTKKAGWDCLEKLLNSPRPYNDSYGKVYNSYYVRFDDPALNGGKPFKPAEIEDEFTDFIEK